jgi:hypothetical protein
MGTTGKIPDNEDFKYAINSHNKYKGLHSQSS